MNAIHTTRQKTLRIASTEYFGVYSVKTRLNNFVLFGGGNMKQYTEIVLYLVMKHHTSINHSMLKNLE